jgi:hypothetical protein
VGWLSSRQMCCQTTSAMGLECCGEVYIVVMSQVLVAEHTDPEIALSEHFAFQSAQIALRAWARYDVGLANAGGVEVITGALA